MRCKKENGSGWICPFYMWRIWMCPRMSCASALSKLRSTVVSLVTAVMGWCPRNRRPVTNPRCFTSHWRISKMVLYTCQSKNLISLAKSVSLLIIYWLLLQLAIQNVKKISTFLSIMLLWAVYYHYLIHKATCVQVNFCCTIAKLAMWGQGPLQQMPITS